MDAAPLTGQHCRPCRWCTGHSEGRCCMLIFALYRQSCYWLWLLHITSSKQRWLCKIPAYRPRLASLFIYLFIICYQEYSNTSTFSRVQRNGRTTRQH